MKKILLISFVILSTQIVYSQDNCNTKISRYSKSCASMYQKYKDAYGGIKAFEKYSDKIKMDMCTPTGHQKLKQRGRAQAEEACDYEIYNYIMDNTVGLACKQVKENKPFLFKSDYCKSHIRH